MTGLQLNTDFRHDLRQSFDNSEETMFLHMPYFVKRAMNGVMIADECIVKGALSEVRKCAISSHENNHSLLDSLGTGGSSAPRFTYVECEFSEHKFGDPFLRWLSGFPKFTLFNLVCFKCNKKKKKSDGAASNPYRIYFLHK
ncbi:hypothetical protein QR680_003353 [Steinernema hermaphroditum]|uniref:Uncharacterized protein n=1 Tax=Steinernema hermaphroditum TaxID=289476 RepID=A0AA39H7B2_9BILA|nr:hypothetical protein QR680_003353 [Steinernema hermaphroditum]